MGHLIKKDLYKKLGEKIDGLTIKADNNALFHAILRELYTTEEADFIIKMPYSLSNIERIIRITKLSESRVKNLLEKLSSKGLVIDFFIDDQYYYSISPLVAGILETSLMKTGNVFNTKLISKLLHEYLNYYSQFYCINFNKSIKVGPLRTIPYVDDNINQNQYVEILDYEKIYEIIDKSDYFSVGYCSCRHEKQHLKIKKCNTPLKTCTALGQIAQFWNKNNFGTEINKSAVIDLFNQSKELGLIINGDNVKNNVLFLCHCCSCCCNLILGIKKHGYPNTIVTSSFIADIDSEKCINCGICVQKCPIQCIKLDDKNNRPVVDVNFCLGCGVCTLKCKQKAIKLHKRKQKVIHPDRIFERIILQSIDRGNLQNYLFDNPNSKTQKFLRAFIGGFLRVSVVKKIILSDSLRSIFLESLENATKLFGMEYLTKI